MSLSAAEEPGGQNSQGWCRLSRSVQEAPSRDSTPRLTESKLIISTWTGSQYCAQGAQGTVIDFPNYELEKAVVVRSDLSSGSLTMPTATACELMWLTDTKRYACSRGSPAIHACNCCSILKGRS